MKHAMNLCKWFIFIVIGSLALTACVRPVPRETVPTSEVTLTPGSVVLPTSPVIEENTPEATPVQEVNPTPTGEPAGEAQPEATATPETTAETPPADTGTTGEQTHIVQAGENLFRIGLRYGFTVDELARYNNIPDPDFIEVGQVIRIPPSQ